MKNHKQQLLATFTVSGSNNTTVSYIIDDDSIECFYFVDAWGMTDSVEFHVGTAPTLDDTQSGVDVGDGTGAVAAPNLDDEVNAI